MDLGEVLDFIMIPDEFLLILVEMWSGGSFASQSIQFTDVKAAKFPSCFFLEVYARHHSRDYRVPSLWLLKLIGS